MRNQVDQHQWRLAFSQEIKSLKQGWPNLNITSLFFGGGTPSLMDVETVTLILGDLDHAFGLKSDVEITLEANPSSVEAKRFDGYKKAGINRLSMGFQSLRDESLNFLGRLHSASDAIKALDIAKKTFSSVSFDLIYALPGQSKKAWQEELMQALTFSPDHLSLYQLTIEEDTAFWYQAKRGDLVIPDEDASLDLFLLTDDLTRSAGLPSYETSNHARAGRESCHNLGYWTGRCYAGLGPGAHGRLPSDKKYHVFETVMEKRPEAWLRAVNNKGHGLTHFMSVSPSDRAQEMVMMGLRLTKGLDLSRVSYATGLKRHDFIDAKGISHMEQLGLLAQDQNFLILTPKGRPLLNRVVAEILL